MKQIHFFNNGTGPIKTSLVVAFYNKIDVLKLVLASLEVQSFKDFELIIADDGSKPEVVQELHQILQKLPMNSTHIWHPDDGWNKNIMLNWSIYHSRSEYMIFIDGDCVLHPQFIEDHWNNRQDNSILAGRRMDLSSFVSKKLTPQRVKSGYLQSNLWWIIPAISLMKDNNGPKGIRIANNSIRKLFNSKARSVVGCNFSVAKSSLLAINGFDTRYTGAGTGEDSDPEYRLNGIGLKTVPLCHQAIQYHIYHPLLNRKNDNETLFQQVMKTQQLITPCGIEQLQKIQS